MALVVFLRGVNVGGHRTFRPSALARELAAFDVVSIGAAGTFVVRKPPSRTELRAALAARLPFATEVMMCDGKELMRLAAQATFGEAPPTREIIRFVSVLSQKGRVRPALPLWLPARGQWLLRVIAAEGQFIVGEYRRQMKAIGYLGRLDDLFGSPATTRSWSTLTSIVRILEA